MKKYTFITLWMAFMVMAMGCGMDSKAKKKIAPSDTQSAAPAPQASVQPPQEKTMQEADPFTVILKPSSVHDFIEIELKDDEERFGDLLSIRVERHEDALTLVQLYLPNNNDARKMFITTVSPDGTPRQIEYPLVRITAPLNKGEVQAYQSDDTSQDIKRLYGYKAIFGALFQHREMSRPIYRVAFQNNEWKMEFKDQYYKELRQLRPELIQHVKGKKQKSTPKSATKSAQKSERQEILEYEGVDMEALAHELFGSTLTLAEVQAKLSELHLETLSPLDITSITTYISIQAAQQPIENIEEK